MIGDAETHRYVLASRCAKPLVVIGVNPSTANETYPDPTVRKVIGFAELNNYDGSVMLNLYAQRSTNFKGVHNMRDEILHQNNLDAIREFFKAYAELDVQLLGVILYLRGIIYWIALEILLMYFKSKNEKSVGSKQER